MLEKPDLPDEKLIACLQDNYGLPVVEITFLPIGNDANTVVYRARTADALPYFVKLRRGAFATISVDVPGFLHDQGIQAIISPLDNKSGHLSTPLAEYHLILSPFVEGNNGFEVALSDAQWKVFGQALYQIHTLALPSTLADRIPHETYSPHWRERVRQFQAQIKQTTFTEPVAAALAALLKDKQPIINHLIQRAEDLAGIVTGQSAHHVLCHSDIHVGNLLFNDQALYIVDWDQPILAPKERDLMFIGAGIGSRHPPEEEKTLFYAGYGEVSIDWVALVYYRYERIVQDIVAYCEQLLLTDEGGADRAQGLSQISGQFLPGDVIDMAYRAEKELPPALQRAVVPL